MALMKTLSGELESTEMQPDRNQTEDTEKERERVGDIKTDQGRWRESERLISIS